MGNGNCGCATPSYNDFESVQSSNKSLHPVETPSDSRHHTSAHNKLGHGSSASLTKDLKQQVLAFNPSEPQFH